MSIGPFSPMRRAFLAHTPTDHVLGSPHGFTNEEGQVTKSELVDQAADRVNGEREGELGGALQPGARAVLAHCRALIDATAEACIAVKLQLASFEALGVHGRSVLGAVAAHARSAGLLVIADGKRGDI